MKMNTHDFSEVCGYSVAIAVETEPQMEHYHLCLLLYICTYNKLLEI